MGYGYNQSRFHSFVALGLNGTNRAARSRHVICLIGGLHDPTWLCGAKAQTVAIAANDGHLVLDVDHSENDKLSSEAAPLFSKE
jgi:hypothetical protein